MGMRSATWVPSGACTECRHRPPRRRKVAAMEAGFPPPPESPCVRNCCLDDADVCLGCGRHLQEILRWQQAGPAERETILARAAERQARRPPPRFS